MANQASNRFETLFPDRSVWWRGRQDASQVLSKRAVPVLKAHLSKQRRFEAVSAHGTLNLAYTRRIAKHHWDDG
jgi:hypothetical protein